MKHRKKIFSIFFTILLVLPVFSVNLSAKTQATRQLNQASKLSKMYSQEYINDIELVGSNIIEENGKYHINYERLNGIDTTLIKRAEDIVYYMNHNEISINNIKITNYTKDNRAEYDFHNCYWWGCAHTLDRSDLQWIVDGAKNVADLAYKFAAFITDLSIQDLVYVSTAVLAAAVTIAKIADIKSLTISWLYNEIPWINIEW